MEIMQRHVLPGFYNQFKAVPSNSFQQRGTLGVVAIGLIMDWGKDDEPTELFSEDLITGLSLRKVGYTLNNKDEILPYMLSLISAYKGYFVKMNRGGVKASVTSGDIKAEALYTGVFGNRISFSIEANKPTTGKYTVTIYIDGARRETFVVSDFEGLVGINSNFVKFSSDEESPSISAVTETSLTGGTNGAVSADSYTAYREQLKYKQYNVCSIMIADETSSNAVIEFVNNQIQVKRKLVQGVVYDKPLLNNYNILTVDQGLECDDFNVTIELNIALITSLRAGCPLNESLTDFNLTELVGARKIINPINDDDDTELENAKAQGKFVYRYISDGSVRVLQDINTLVNFTADEPVGYRKNRHIAILDYLINEENRIAHSGPIGKYSNTAEKRNLIAAKFITIYNELYQMGAIKEYDAVTDMILTIGDESDLVNVNQTVKPTDSIEIINSVTNVDFNNEA